MDEITKTIGSKKDTVSAEELYWKLYAIGKSYDAIMVESNRFPSNDIPAGLYQMYHDLLTEYRQMFLGPDYGEDRESDIKAVNE